MEQQLVVFELASEYYGIDIAAVESIMKMQSITRLPHTPGFMEGVTNLRGRVVPVIDLRSRFDLPSRPDASDSRIVVTNINQVEVGMIVDGVSEVLRVPAEAIEPPPPITASGLDSAFITGIAKIKERLIILLDLSRILSQSEKAQLPELAVA